MVKYLGMVGGDFQDLHAIIIAIPGERFRFLSADRRRAYAAILWILLHHRRAHRIEVYYDDLMVEALTVVPGASRDAAPQTSAAAATATAW